MAANRSLACDHGWRLLVVGSLPGLLLGIHIANQLFFLNPDLPFRSLTVARVALSYGAIGGLFSALLLTPVTWKRGDRSVRILPWALTLVLIFVAVSDFVLASRYSFYLPPGIIQRMIKAAIWLSLLSLVFFYTALLHTLHSRPYGIRSRIGLSFVALLSIYVVTERREAFKPYTAPAPLPSVVETAQRPTLYLVGLGGASLDAILPLSAQGRLPFFARMLDEGVSARPASLAPVQGEALWTTLATGRMPFTHRIVSSRVYPADWITRGGWVRLLPTIPETYLWEAFAKPELIDSTHRSAVPMWGVLDRLRFKTGLIGWPVTDPVPNEALYNFSHRYFQGHFGSRTAQPAELAERGLLFRINPEEIDPALLEELGGRVPYEFLQDLAEDLWRESLTLFMLDQQPDAQAVFMMLPGLARVSSRNFGGFSEVLFSGNQREPYSSAAQRLTAYYRHLDQLLATLWERDPGPKLLAVVSAYGFEAPEGWRRLRAVVTGRGTAGLYQQAPDGLFLMMGDGLRQGEFLEGVELVDIMPTLLYYLGVPIARDLEGRVLTGAFSSSFMAGNPFTVVPSYETMFVQEGLVQPPPVPR